MVLFLASRLRPALAAAAGLMLALHWPPGPWPLDPWPRDVGPVGRCQHRLWSLSARVTAAREGARTAQSTERTNSRSDFQFLHGMRRLEEAATPRQEAIWRIEASALSRYFSRAFPPS